MARTARPTGPAKPRTRGTPTSKPRAPATKKGAAPAAATKKAPARGPREAAAPRLTRDELQARVTKLERENERLRLRSRDSSKSAKDSEARIEELETQLRRLERRVAAQDRPSRPRRREVDPGDAVPPGVAVEEAEPDAEAEAARENLTTHLHDEEA